MKWKVTENWGPKVVCLVVAIILWLFIMNDQNPLVEGEYNLQVEVQHLDTSLVALNVPETVHVKLRMQRNTMLHLRESDMKAIVNLHDVGPGEYHEIPIELVVPKEAEVLDKTPKTLSMKIDHIVFKSITPTVKLMGQAASGWALEVNHVNPEQVTISGPESIVAEVQTALVTVSAEGRKDTFQTIAPVSLLNAHGEQVTEVSVTPATISVSVLATQDQIERTIPLEQNIVGDPSAGYAVTDVQVIPNQVKLIGSRREIGDVTTWKLPPVSISGARESRTERVDIPIPESGKTEPAVAEVQIRIEPLQ